MIALLRRRWLDVVLFALVGAGLGMLVGVFTSVQTEALDGRFDPTGFQNYGLAVGAVVGVAVALLAMLFFLGFTRVTGKTELLHFRLYVWVAGIAGAIVTIATFCIVTSSASRFGIVERTGTAAIVDGVISALIGGGTGAVVSAVLSAVRGYNA